MIANASRDFSVKLLASLNHPNIAHIHGLEESNGVCALVMELVEGSALADRIAQGPVPIAEALPIARQIADALEAAHGQAIIHRDLKPANIKIRDDGTVKVLDFGLAKALEPAPAGPRRPGDWTASPTITSPAQMTGAGMLLGTAAYMAPEQARGKTVDTRADIWALGCVLFEMLTARPAFPGDDVSVVLARVIEREPDWPVLSTTTPPSIRALLQACLVKDPKERLRDAGDLRLWLDGKFSPAVADGGPHRDVRDPVWKSRVLIGGAALVVGASMAAAATWLTSRTPAPLVTRTTIATPDPAGLTTNGSDRDIAITPDGTRIVYVGDRGRQLFVRALDALEPVSIARGSVLRLPFISPDGQWVGFVEANNVLKRVGISGGSVTTVARLDGGSRGAAWAPDNTIVFATSNQATGLQRVSADGGLPEMLTQPDHARGEQDHFWPELLPGGHAVLFTISSSTRDSDGDQIAVRDLKSGSQRTIVRGGTDGRYVPSGHLVYRASDALWAVPFDVDRLETRGTAVRVLPRLVGTFNGGADLDVARNGTLVYTDAPGVSEGERTLVWVDRTGHETPLGFPARPYLHPRLSPDGARGVVAVMDAEQDLWSWDVRQPALARLTFDQGTDNYPVWTPDSRRIIFSSERGRGPQRIWWRAANGTGDAERLTTSNDTSQWTTGITPDGTRVIFNQQTPGQGRDLFMAAVDGTRRVTPLVQTKFDERNGVVSSDGRWLAYDSNSSGNYEIYVRPFPEVGAGQWQVSTSGGVQPVWARDARELFFFTPDGVLQQVPVQVTGGTWGAGAQKSLFDGRYFVGGTSAGATYDVSPDGRRFLMTKPSGDSAAASPSLVVVQHWDQELKRLVPTR